MPTPDFESGVKLRLGRLVAKTVTKYFSDESHRKEFEEWYFQKYGKPYQWKKGCGKPNDSPENIQYCGV